MGVAERRLREKNHRTTAILKAAKRLIAKHGVEGMSMNDLAGATELNKATLYLYFSDKDDLVDAIVYEGLGLLEKAFEKADRSCVSGLERVRSLARANFEFYRRYPVYFYTMNHQERRSESERLETPYAAKGNEAAARVFGRIAEAVRQGMADGSIREDIDINGVLVLLYAHTYGVTHTIYSKEDVYKDVFGLTPAVIEQSALQMIECYLTPGKRSAGRAG